ncbi:MAG: hypothetical protein EHM72_14070 [Calditrichaeota bacterium]|nr:MAG: hypothetical protein EHM72_14070 [Calditrichota bacterium]
MLMCSRCGKDLKESGGDNVIASISGSIMGDEMTETFYECPKCHHYTLEICHDRFCGETTCNTQGPYSLAEVGSRISLIKQCSEPWDKKCRCEAHVRYFDGWLD